MLTLVPGGMGGSETYAQALTRELAGSRDVNATAYVAAIGAGFSHGVPERVVPGVSGGPTTRSRITTLVQAAMRRRAICASWADAAVVHYPFTVPVPRPAAPNAVVVSLLDVQHLDLPGLFSRAERTYRRRFYDSAARRADVVITISEFTKSRIVETLGIEPSRIIVAPLGVDAPSSNRISAPARTCFCTRPAHGPTRTTQPSSRRSRCCAPRIPPSRLVLTGGGLDRLGAVPAGVDVRGLVGRDELRELYRTASALVFPSLYEGFGLPRSRRWRRAARSPRRAPVRSQRSAATPRPSLRPRRCVDRSRCARSARSWRRVAEPRSRPGPRIYLGGLCHCPRTRLQAGREFPR